MESGTVWEKREGIAQSRESRFQVTVMRLKTFSAMKRIRLSSCVMRRIRRAKREERAERSERIQSVSTLPTFEKPAGTHVPERRPPERDHETRRIENHLHREPDFGQDLLVREGRHVLMGPGVEAVVCSRCLDLQELVRAGRGNQSFGRFSGVSESPTYNCTIRLPITGKASAPLSRLMRSAGLTVMRRRDLVLGNELRQVGRRRRRPIIERQLRAGRQR